MDWPNVLPHLPVISSWSPESTGIESALKNGFNAPVDNAWQVLSQARYVTLAIRAPFNVRRIWWANGATLAGNIEVAVFAMGGQKLCTSGSTAQAGTSVIQSVALTTPYRLLPGPYYMGIGSSNINAQTIYFQNIAAREQAIFGKFNQSSTYPLPDPTTPNTANTAINHLFGIADVAVI